nr:MAG TPA: hypothetical protein [Caudoviricetes sp.]
MGYDKVVCISHQPCVEGVMGAMFFAPCFYKMEI